MSSFDANHKAIISAFISLKAKATLLEKHLLSDSYHINRNDLPFIEVQSYFSLLRSVCDLPIFMLINEEVSNAGARTLIPRLVDEIRTDKCIATQVAVDGKPEEISQEDFHESLSDIRELFVSRVNHMVSSLMLDFTVSAFSCFEYWITKLYEGYPELSTAYSEGRKSRASKLIERAGRSSSSEEQRKLVDDALKLRGNFESFSDRLNALYKIVDKKAYARDINRDKELVSFLGARRNAVHNAGVHRNNTRNISHKGASYVLEEGKPFYSKSYPQSIEMVGELADIYVNIVRSLKQPPQSSLASEFVQQEVLIQFEETIRCALACPGPAPVAALLCDFFGIGKRQAANIADAVNAIKADPSWNPKEFSIYQILKSDLQKPRK
ncbi:hypothetical protein [Stenotrophomonas forensis]